jgi:hypothetical protein
MTLTRTFRFVIPLIAALTVAGAAQAQCYADYKAKRGQPMQLHYGVIALPQSACGNTGAAAAQIAPRLAADGWELLSVVSVFGQEGLASRQGNAGAFFLRY